MYHEPFANISKTDDDKFVVEIREKKKKTKGSKNEVMCDSPAESKMFVADNTEDLKGIIDKHIGKMKGHDDDDEFKEGYEEATKKKGD